MSPLVAAAVCAAPVFTLAACASVGRPNVGPLVTDRPDFTESSETVPRTLVQLESGATYTHERDARAGSFGEALVRVGVSNRSELRVALNSYTIERRAGMTEHGLEDVAIGTKVKLLNGGETGSPKPSVAVIVGTTFPTGASAFRSANLEPEVKFIGAWSLTQRVAFSSNVNYAWTSDGVRRFGEPSASASLGVGVSDRVGSYVEYFGFYPRIDGAERSHFANGGVTFSINDDVQLDARLGAQMKRRGDGRSVFLGVGLSRRW